MELKNSEFTVEIHKEDNITYLYIGSEDSSGYEYKVNSLDDVTSKIKGYMENVQKYLNIK